MRLFIAIEFPDPILNAIVAIQRELRGKVQKGRFKQSGNFHLTLKFLGETFSRHGRRFGRATICSGKEDRRFLLAIGAGGCLWHAVADPGYLARSGRRT